LYRGTANKHVPCGLPLPAWCPAIQGGAEITAVLGVLAVIAPLITRGVAHQEPVGSFRKHGVREWQRAAWRGRSNGRDATCGLAGRLEKHWADLG
jgi:hypothetical protein